MWPGPTWSPRYPTPAGWACSPGWASPPDALATGIAESAANTAKPFGVNLWLHDELRPPVAPDALAEADVAAVQTELNRFRTQVGVEPVPAGLRPAPTPDLLGDALDVILEAAPAVFSVGLGDPGADLVATFP